MVTRSTYQRLVEEFPELDHQLKERRIFSVKEKKGNYRLEGLDGYPNIDYKVDGVLIPGSVEKQKKCDCLLLISLASEIWVQVFVELKGANAEKALRQLEDTLSHPLFSSCCRGEKRVARLVASSFPANKSDNGLEKTKKRLLQKYNCSVRTFKSGQPEDFSKLLASLKN